MKLTLAGLSSFTTPGSLGLGRQELRVNVGQDTTLRDGDRAEKAVELFVISDSELQVTRNDTRFLCSKQAMGQLEK